MLITINICVSKHLSDLLISPLLSHAFQEGLEVLVRDKSVFVEVHHRKSLVKLFLHLFTVHLSSY
jgi:hypothetical protein